MKKFRKFICFLFGHRSICLFRDNFKNQYGVVTSTSTGWVCERCGKIKTEGWDI